MKFVITTRHGKPICVRYKSKSALERDLKTAIEKNKKDVKNWQANRAKWEKKKPSASNPDKWLRWADERPNAPWEFSFAGRQWETHLFGTVNEKVSLPTIQTLEEWFESEATRESAGV